MHSDSFLSFVMNNRPVVSRDNRPISGEISWQVDQQSVIAQEVALENGNSGTRVMMLNPKTHVPVITQTANTLEAEDEALIFSTGDMGEFWQEENLDGTKGRIFRVGEYAIGKDLPIGETDQRWALPEFVAFNRACLARTFHAAGYPPGTYYAVIAPGARNEEVSVEAGPKPEVQNAFLRGLQPFVIWRNKTERYDIRPVMIMRAMPQTFGSFYSYDSNLLGRTLNPDIPVWNVFDIGFFDGHNVTVKRIGGNIRVTGHKVTGGMANVVRDLGTFLRRAGNFPKMAPPTYTQALEMMRSGEVKIAGVPLQDDHEIERGRQLIKSFKDKEGGSLIQDMIQNHLEMDSVFMFTGGSVVDLLEQIAAKTANRPANLTKIIPPHVSRVANVAGIFLLLNIAYRQRSVLRYG